MSSKGVFALERRTEKEMLFLKSTTSRVSPTLLLIVANMAVYAYLSFIGNNFIQVADVFLKKYGQFNYAVLYHGSWWQLVTSMFVHANIVHIASNMLFLLIFGLRAEELFSDLEYYATYLASGLAGNLLSLLWPISTVSVGASGAIFGLFGSVTMYSRGAVDRSIVGVLLIAFFFFAITLSAGTNIFAHLGGLFTGLALGYWLAKTHKPALIV